MRVILLTPLNPVFSRKGRRGFENTLLDKRNGVCYDATDISDLKGVVDMPLQGLLALVERLRERIDAHGAALRGSEALTRYALIDPMLRELGWDTSDPDMVIPEYSSGGGRADYALLSDGRPVMPVVMVEAKSLGSSLGGAVAQGIQYCLMQGTSYFSVTDGRRWEVYETHRPVPIDEKQVVSFDLKGPSAAEACLQALSLWRPGVISGSVRPGQAPVVGLPDAGPIVQPPPNIIDEIIDEPGWEPISTFKPVPSISGNPPPSEILFPDNSRTGIRTWTGVTEAIVRWLMENNFLNATHCPIQYGVTYILATSPTHPSGRPIRCTKINSLYLNINYNSRDHMRNSRLIIERVGRDPAQFKVRLP